MYMYVIETLYKLALVIFNIVTRHRGIQQLKDSTVYGYT